MGWRSGQQKASHCRARYGVLLNVLPLALVLWLAACAPGSAGSTSLHNPATTSTPGSASSRIHNITPGSFTLFVRVTFTSGTTYDEAVAILGGRVYPWTCDAPRSPTPPPVSDQQASFAASNTLLMSYPTQDDLARIAASSQVVSVDGVALYQCS